jgi:site-specific recombinase XerD
VLHAGLRVGEVVHLEVADVQLATGRTPHLRLNGKGQRERIVYLSATAAACLRDYLSTRPPESGSRVFLNRRGQPITITGIQLQLAKYCRQAGVWVTCHQLRHTFACRLIAADVPVTSIQKLLGHQSLRTTQRYIQVADSQVERDYRAGIQKVLVGAAPAPSGGAR